MLIPISLQQVAEIEGYGSDMEMLTDLGYDSIVPACCECGAQVEPDGFCEHGNPSIILEFGII